MCFYNDDCDWSASVWDKTEGPSPEGCKCDECGERIAAGDWRRHVYAQEHEACQICEDEWSGAFDEDADPQTCDHDYGESATYVCCESCAKVLLSIEAHEQAAGCPQHAQQPTPGQLWDELYNHDDGPTYAREAMEVWPELQSWERLAELVEAVE